MRAASGDVMGWISGSMNEIPKVVFSNTMKQADWEGTRVVSGDVGEEIARLRREPSKDILLHGVPRSAVAVELGLIDEYRLIVHPVVLAGGLPLFDRTMGLKLLETRSFPAGAVALIYGRA